MVKFGVSLRYGLNYLNELRLQRIDTMKSVRVISRVKTMLWSLVVKTLSSSFIKVDLLRYTTERYLFIHIAGSQSSLSGPFKTSLHSVVMKASNLTTVKVSPQSTNMSAINE
jgi:hypothetical protein